MFSYLLPTIQSIKHTQNGQQRSQLLYLLLILVFIMRASLNNFVFTKYIIFPWCHSDFKELQFWFKTRV